jgi:VanZ family protein
LYLQHLVDRHLRTVTMLATVAIVASLFIGGRQPVAVNLVSHPWDKLLHAGVFALLACTIGLASDFRGRQKLVVAFFGALLVGVLDEWHQMYLPGREAGWSDFIADVIGSIFGTAFLAIVLSMKGKRSLPIS